MGIGYLAGGIGIGDYDWRLVLWVRIYEWGLGYMIVVLDLDSGLRLY